MGACMPGGDSDKVEKFEKGKENDCSNGPVENRGCTDILCCLLWVLHILVFIAVAGGGMAEGQPKKLYVGRDYQGNFCDLPKNWETGKDLSNFPNLFYSMNVTPLVDDIAKQYVCSDTAKTILVQSNAMTDDEYKKACPPGLGILDAKAAAEEAMKKYQDPKEVVNLLKGGGGSSILSQITKYFVAICTTGPDCPDPTKMGDDKDKPVRSYQYSPGPDAPWKKAWDLVKDLPGFPAESFAFTAMPEAICPYNEKFCVPFPGLSFTNIAGYCTMSISSDTTEGLSKAGIDTSALDSVMADAEANAVTQDFGTMVGDVAIAWPALAATAFLSLVVGIAFMVILRFTVGVMVWLAVLLVFLLFAGGGVLAITGATQCKGDSLEAAGTKLGGSVTEQATSAANSTVSSGSTDAAAEEGVTLPECKDGYEIADETQRTVVTYVGYVLLALAAIYLLIVICMFNRIRIAIAINKVAATFVSQTKAIILVPICQILIFILYMAVWTVIIVFIVSQTLADVVPNKPFASYAEAAGTDTVPGKCTDKWPTGGVWKDEFAEECSGDEPKCWKCYPPRYGFNERFAFAFFSYLWNNAFLIAFGQMTVAGATAVWYFTPNQEKGQRPAVRTGVYNSLRFHTGTLAFGAFILAVVQFIRYFLYYLQKQAEAQKNPLVALICKILQYLILCFERCIKFLNKNAYIQCALLGTNFCKSAWNATMLIIRNAARIGILGGIGKVVRLIGTFFIMVVTVFVGYQLLKALHKDEVSSPVLPVLFMIMMGWCSAKLVMNVFGLAVDTVLQCFVADEEMNKDRTEKSECTPEQLGKFMDDPGNKSAGCCTIM